VSTTPLVTVAVPVKDRRADMLACLEGILAQDYAPFEVLVLDNGSTDGTPEACSERGATAEVEVRVETVEGLVGRVRNAAGPLAHGEIIAFIDSDCIPEPGWLSAGVAALLASDRLGIVQGRTEPMEDVTGKRLPHTIDVPEMSWWFEGCNLFVRRHAFVASAGFDETLRYGEDAMGGWAVVKAGWEPGFTRDAVVRHAVTYPGLGWHLRRVQNYANFPLLVRHHPELRYRALHHRYFLRRRDPKLVAAAVGVALAVADRRALALALPYAWLRVPRSPHPVALRGATDALLTDASALLGLVRGSWRHRRLVL
jgi:glycosyltransferase involved in cell wall biosynthesis